MRSGSTETPYRLLSPDRPRLGWLCSYTPVEIPLAAGYLPIRISGGERLPRSQDPRIYHLLCPYIRAVFHRYASGEDALPDAVAFVRCCDGMLRLHDLWKAYIPGSVYLLDLPKMTSPWAVAYFAEMLRGWAATLEQKGPREITHIGLADAIHWMNEARALFREMLGALSQGRASITYGRLHGWVRSWLSQPSSRTLVEMRREWQELVEVGATDEGRPRVLIISTMLDQSGLIGMVEEAGLAVVSEDECMGARHFDRDVQEDGDPFQALAERYLNRWPCTRMKGLERRFERLDRVIAESRVDGVLAFQLKYCDQSAFDLPLLSKYMEAKGKPLLVVENDYGEGSWGQLRTRIEAFAEMLMQPWA